MTLNIERIAFLLGQLPACDVNFLQGMAEDCFDRRRTKLAAEGRSRLRLVVMPANPAPDQPSAEKGQ